MIIGATQYQLLRPSQKEPQSSENTHTQQQSFRLAEDRITLSGRSEAPSPTYARPGLARKEPERSLTQIAWDNLLAQRIGLSKEKLDKIEQRKQEIAEDPNLSAEEREKLLEDLEKEEEALIKEASERRQTRGDEERQSNPEPDSLT